jgi:hypothetical protein
MKQLIGTLAVCGVFFMGLGLGKLTSDDKSLLKQVDADLEETHRLVANIANIKEAIAREEDRMGYGLTAWPDATKNQTFWLCDQRGQNCIAVNTVQRTCNFLPKESK